MKLAILDLQIQPSKNPTETDFQSPGAHHFQDHLVMTNIAMENPQNKWRYLAGKIIHFYGPSIPWL